MAKTAKPPALEPGAAIRIVSPASPVEESEFRAGCHELERLGYAPRWDPRVLARQGYFAGSAEERTAKLVVAFEEASSSAVFCARGGYGSNYLLELLDLRRLKSPKILMGYSDITSLQLFLWRKKGWVTFYGPMVAAGIEAGANQPAGYNLASFMQAITEAHHGWALDLVGEILVAGSAEGVLLGGCLTLLETSLATPWEIQTRGAILLLEDRAMKPFQVDRALVHLRQAGKFAGLRAVILGEFPESDVAEGGPSVRDVCERLLSPLRIPIVWAAAVGHTARPMLTLPLGVRARLTATGTGKLQFLESACSPPAARAAPTGKPANFA